MAVNPFLPNFTFLYPLKTLENLKQGYRNVSSIRIGLTRIKFRKTIRLLKIVISCEIVCKNFKWRCGFNYCRSHFSKTIEVQIVDHEEYEKDKVFKVVLGEPKIVRCEAAQISNLDSVQDLEIKKILEAGKPALGKLTFGNIHPILL